MTGSMFLEGALRAQFASCFRISDWEAISYTLDNDSAFAGWRFETAETILVAPAPYNDPAVLGSAFANSRLGTHVRHDYKIGDFCISVYSKSEGVGGIIFNPKSRNLITLL